MRKYFGKKKSNHRSAIENFLKFVVISIGCFLCIATCVLYDIPEIERITEKFQHCSISLKDSDGVDICVHNVDASKYVEALKLDKNVYSLFFADANKQNGLLCKFFTKIGYSKLSEKVAELLFDEKTLSLRQKIQKIIIAFMIERKFSIAEIFSSYINKIYFGQDSYGIQAASKRFFGKDASQIDVPQAAVLIALSNAKNKYYLLNNPSKLKEQSHSVIFDMTKFGIIPTDQSSEILQCIDDSTCSIFQAEDPKKYFIEYIVDEVNQHINVVSQTDVAIFTTFNRKLMSYCTSYFCDSFEEKLKTSDYNQIACVILNKNHEILSIIGGNCFEHQKGYDTKNRAVYVSKLNALPHYFLYLFSLQNGININQEISDAQINISNAVISNDQWQTRGNTTIAEAFAHALETPLIRLFQRADKNKFSQLLNKFQIDYRFEEDKYPCITICANLIGAASCYACAINDGKLRVPFSVKKIKNKFGKIIYLAKSDKEKTICSHIVASDLKLLLRGSFLEQLSNNQNDICGTMFNEDQGISIIGFSKGYIFSIFMGNDKLIKHRIHDKNQIKKFFLKFIENISTSKFLHKKEVKIVDLVNSL